MSTYVVLLCVSILITLAITIFIIWLAIVKYDFLKILPIAHKNIIDHISDGFVVVDEEFIILEYNKTFGEVFYVERFFNKNVNILDIFSSVKFKDIEAETVKDKLKSGIIDRKQVRFELGVRIFENTKYFSIEMNPLYLRSSYRGSVILLKDVTEQIKKIEIIKENEVKLLKAEKFSFLGEVTGGLTHIIKNKISSIGYYAVFFEHAIPRYHELLNTIQSEGISEKQTELYEGAQKRAQAIKSVVKDIDIMISNVSNQMAELGKEEEISHKSTFTLEDFLVRMKSFVELEAKEQGYFIDMEIDEEQDLKIVFKGVLGVFIQAIMNLFANSFYEYKKNRINERLILKIEQSEDENYVEFYVKDFGPGIPEEIKGDLFKKVITTKGEDGTGIGLYTTYSAIKDKLNGTIELLETQKGATFLIRLPFYR